jgi:hypothetical protein
MIPIGQWLARLPESPEKQCLSNWDEATKNGMDVLAAEQKLSGAYESGRAEAEAEFRLQLEAAEAAGQRDYAQLLNHERQRWLQEDILPLTVKLRTVIEKLGQDLSNSIADVLKPFVADSIRQRALTKFRLMLECHLASEDGALVRLKAPRDILDAVTPDLQSSGLRFETVEADGCDIILEAGPMSFETQVGKWLEALGVESHG